MLKTKKWLLILTISSFLCGCDYFEIETKTLIDYRHDAAYTEVGTDYNDKLETIYHPESWHLYYEITYADGHTKRVWEDCTRFEYKKAVEELGE